VDNISGFNMLVDTLNDKGKMVSGPVLPFPGGKGYHCADLLDIT